MKTKIALTIFTLAFIVGCGTTFEQRVPYYKMAIHFGIEAMTNGTATNVVGTAKGLIGR